MYIYIYTFLCSIFFLFCDATESPTIQEHLVYEVCDYVDPYSHDTDMNYRRFFSDPRCASPNSAQQLRLGSIDFTTAYIQHLSEDLFYTDKTLFQDMKILVLIIACDINATFPDTPQNDPVYPELQKVWRSYMHLDPDHVEAYFMKSDPNLTAPFKIEGDTIWTQGQETWIPGILNKTIVSMEAMLPRLDEFDYIIRTNLSSFYVFPRLFKFLKTLPKEKCYSGVRVPFHHWSFMSGCGFILSPDLVRLLVQHKNQLYNHSTIDDVVIGRFFYDQLVPFTDAPRTDFTSIRIWDEQKNTIPEYAFHFRTRNPPGLRLSHELSIQKALLGMFYGIQAEERSGH